MFNDVKEFKANNMIKKYPHDAGWDVRSAEGFIFSPKTNIKISTGLHLVMPRGFKAIARSRSGLAVNQAIECTNAGVIDYGYTGEIFLRIYNNSNDPFYLKKGDRIAQFVFDYSHTVPVRELLDIAIPQAFPELKPTEFYSLEFDRGSKGLGSTGKN